MTATQEVFVEKVWEFYRTNGRDLPWRDEPTPYQVLVSEVMLQQTQVSRVTTKYLKWLTTFPDIGTLAAASTAEVIRAWQGLGYNRRALWLQRSAQQIEQSYGGIVPDEPAELVKLPGIGQNTAASIVVFAYNKPLTFIETNIRRVYIHEFFPNDDGVSDSELMPIIKATVSQEHPRDWFYALMDYGSHLALTVPNPNRRSRHYAKQSQFEGSKRQLRGEVLRQLLDGRKTVLQLNISDGRLAGVLAELKSEGFIVECDGTVMLVDNAS